MDQKFKKDWLAGLVFEFYICNPFAGIAQLVEHDLAKVGVASSSLVSRSSFRKTSVRPGFFARIQSPPAWWQSGHAAACKAVYAGSIPTQASIQPVTRPGGEIGRRMGLKIPR